MINEKIIKVLTDDNAKKAAEYFIDRVKKSGKDVSIDYDWQLSSGKMLSGPINTEFKMDIKPEDILMVDIKNALGFIFDADEAIDEAIQPMKNTVKFLSDDSKEQMEKLIKSFEEKDKETIEKFLMSIKSHLEKTYLDDFRKVIRAKVLNGSEEAIFPLDNIEVVNIEIGEKPQHDYVIVVQKNSPKEMVESGDSKKDEETVAQDLMKTHSETGRDLNDIISQRKEEEDKRYDYVSGAYKKQYWFDCHLELCVDYSLGEMPEEVKQQMDT